MENITVRFIQGSHSPSYLHYSLSSTFDYLVANFLPKKDNNIQNGTLHEVWRYMRKFYNESGFC